MEIRFYSDGKKFSYGLCIEAEYFESLQMWKSLYFSNIENGNLQEKEIPVKNEHGISLKNVNGKLQLKKQPLTVNEFEIINQILHGSDKIITIKYLSSLSRSNICKHFDFKGIVRLPSGERIEMQ
jgi:hypothetical protein